MPEATMAAVFSVPHFDTASFTTPDTELSVSENW